MRVVRFYQSCSPPCTSSPSPPPSPPPPLPSLPCPLPPCQLFAKLFANFRTQWPLLDLNCKGLSALGTAGPAQWAPLDLNLGPSELSEHRWTSTWDPPCQKICQNILQKICQVECQKNARRMPDRMPDKMPEYMSDRMPEDLPVTKRIDVMVGITRSKVIFASAPRSGFEAAVSVAFAQTSMEFRSWASPDRSEAAASRFLAVAAARVILLLFAAESCKL